MAKLETTTKEFRAGLAVSETKTTIKWDPTGHISVQLLDTSGTRPLTSIEVTVDVPKEGAVSLTSDAEGMLFHPDVPFQDYELDLGDLGKVRIPAVASRGERHLCPVPKATLGWIDLDLVDDRGIPIAKGAVQVDDVELTIGDAGRATSKEPRPANRKKIKVIVGDLEVEVQLPVLRLRTTVKLPKKDDSP